MILKNRQKKFAFLAQNPVKLCKNGIRKTHFKFIGSYLVYEINGLEDTFKYLSLFCYI
jgi:hypothetical protein